MADVSITGTQRCSECGRFIADRQLPISRLHFEPLNEFGPEVIEWTCPPCVASLEDRDAPTSPYPPIRG